MTNGLPEPSDIDRISFISTPVCTSATVDSESSITANHITATIS